MAKNLTLENSYLKVLINTLGAELTSFYDKKGGVEHMWGADPQFWPRRAPILFPCVGESKNGMVSINGRTFPMVRHGFTRMQEFILTDKGSDFLALELTENKETLNHYPFRFRLRVVYTLKERSLEQRFEVLNTDAEPFGFQLGGHPAFAVPFGADGAFSDYCVKFDRELTLDRHLLNKSGLYSGETRPVLEGSDELDLYYDLFNEDALVFKNIPCKRVWIMKKDGGKRLEVKYADFLHLGIWSVPGANYVCVEPWIGCADSADQNEDFRFKDSVVTIGPKESFSAAFSVSVLG
ncbi:MAG: hypothetical protein RL266_502 [Bacteroidota bacterium]|jgi:galactose mutarotase-like enzyme